MITSYNIPYQAEVSSAPAGKRNKAFRIVSFFTSLFNNGLYPELHSYEKLRVRTFNILIVASLLIALVNVGMALLDNSVPDKGLYLLYNAVPIVCCGFVFFLVKWRRARLAFLLAFSIFPLLMLAMNFMLDDRAIMYFQIVFMVFPFFFFDNPKTVVLLFLLSLICFGTGVFYEMEEHSHQLHKGLRTYEVISFVSAMALFFATLFFVKKKVMEFQQKINRQRKELEEKNAKLEEQRRLLDEKNSTLNKIFSIISHDLRTPVEGLRLTLEAFHQPEDIRNAVASVFPELKAEAAKMSSLFQNLLTWAKLEMKATDFTMKEVHIKAVCEKVVHTLEAQALQKEIAVKIEAEPDDMRCTGDPHVLEIVLRNLVSNAIKFCSAGDSICIKAITTPAQLLLTVTDTGSGMSADVLARVRDRQFYSSPGTAYEKGTGLGLMICAEMIGKYNGTLRIESEEGKGTTVTIEVPVGKS